MYKAAFPITQVVRVLRDKHIAFEPHLYAYKDRGGTEHSAAALGVNEHAVVKTLVMETDDRTPIIVLMHGDREVSTKTLARVLAVKSVTPCDPAQAQRHTGYMVGGTSPFGTRKAMPVYAEKTIFDLPTIYINGGRRGFLVSIDPKDLRLALAVVEVETAVALADGD